MPVHRPVLQSPPPGMRRRKPWRWRIEAPALRSDTYHIPNVSSCLSRINLPPAGLFRISLTLWHRSPINICRHVYSDPGNITENHDTRRDPGSSPGWRGLVCLSDPDFAAYRRLRPAGVHRFSFIVYSWFNCQLNKVFEFNFYIRII